MKLSNESIDWATGHRYNELSPLIPPEHIALDLLEQAVKSSWSEYKMKAPTGASTFFGRVVDLGIKTGNLDYFNEARDIYENLPANTVIKDKLSSYEACIPILEAQSERRYPDKSDLTDVENSIWNILLSARDLIVPQKRRKVPEARLSAAHEIAAEGIPILLSFEVAQNDPKRLLLPSTARERVPTIHVVNAVGKVQHDLHSYNITNPENRNLLSIRLKQGSATGKVPVFRLLPAANMILERMPDSNPQNPGTSIPEIITYLEEARKDGNRDTINTKFRSALWKAIHNSMK